MFIHTKVLEDEKLAENSERLGQMLRQRLINIPSKLVKSVRMSSTSRRYGGGIVVGDGLQSDGELYVCFPCDLSDVCVTCHRCPVAALERRVAITSLRQVRQVGAMQLRRLLERA